MRYLITCFVIQLVLLAMLIKEPTNDGERKLFQLQKWTGVDVIITVLLVDCVYFVYFLRFQYNILQSLPADYLYFIILIIIILLFRLKFKTNLFDLGFVNSNGRIAVVAGLIVALVGVVIVYALYYSLGKPRSYTYYFVEETKFLRTTIDWLQFFIFSVFVAPVVEEILYRGVLYSPYRKRYGSTAAIIITSVLFSVSHFGLSFLSTFIGGILLAILYEKTESLISPIIAHVAFNLINITTLLVIQRQ